LIAKETTKLLEVNAHVHGETIVFYHISIDDAILFLVVEPLTLLGLAYISYLMAEVIHFSGHIW